MATIDEALRLYPKFARYVAAKPWRRTAWELSLRETQLLETCTHGRVHSGAVRVGRHLRRVDDGTWEIASIELGPEADGAPMPPADELALVQSCMNHDMIGYRFPVEDPDEQDLKTLTWADGRSFPVDHIYDDIASYDR